MLNFLPQGMARNIIAKANLEKPLIIYNRTIKRCQDLQDSLDDPTLLRVAESIEEAIGAADIIFTSLSSDASVNLIIGSALQTPGGVKGKLFVETSTILPETSDDVAQRVRDAGAEFIAAPGK